MGEIIGEVSQTELSNFVDIDSGVRDEIEEDTFVSQLLLGVAGLAVSSMAIAYLVAQRTRDKQQGM